MMIYSHMSVCCQLHTSLNAFDVQLWLDTWHVIVCSDAIAVPTILLRAKRLSPPWSKLPWTQAQMNVPHWTQCRVSWFPSTQGRMHCEFTLRGWCGVWMRLTMPTPPGTKWRQIIAASNYQQECLGFQILSHCVTQNGILAHSYARLQGSFSILN